MNEICNLVLKCLGGFVELLNPLKQHYEFIKYEFTILKLPTDSVIKNFWTLLVVIETVKNKTTYRNDEDLISL